MSFFLLSLLGNVKLTLLCCNWLQPVQFVW